MKITNTLKNVKSLIIRGAQNSGKSITIQEVCKCLNPSEVYKLNFERKTLEELEISEIFNGTYIIKVENEFILIIAGAPTEQKYSITTILCICIEICKERQIQISFILSARRFAERKGFDTTGKLFNTTGELTEYTTLLKTIDIKSIGKDYKNSEKWDKRIEEIVQIIHNNLKRG
ncbi:MAG: hypothetical protein LBR75_03185 [Prevotellaceae bacterium]|jgi:hypothetical protein|nr:hypothetical protein [Prevotellaceae bacterium]